MRRTKAETAQTRQQVLDAALIVFSQKGYAATTLEDIADQANLTRGAIYWHFKDKADLYLVLVKEVSAQVYSAAAEHLAQGQSPIFKLRRLLVWQLESVETNPKYRAVLELMAFKTEVSPELSEGMTRKAAGTSAMIAQIEALIQAALASGELRADVDPHSAALAAMGLVSGLISMWFLVPDTFSLVESAGRAVDLLLHGMAG